MEQVPAKSAPLRARPQAASNTHPARERVVWDEERRAGFAEFIAALREAYEALRAEGYELIDGILMPPPNDV